jgi:hypothetical protein
VWPPVGVLRLPVRLQVPVAGSYSSPEPEESPPTTSTLPFGSNVAVWPDRAMLRLPVGIQRGITCPRAIVFRINVATITDRMEAKEWRAIFLVCFMAMTPFHCPRYRTHDFDTVESSGVKISKQ